MNIKHRQVMYRGFLLEYEAGAFPWRINKIYKNLGIAFICKEFTLKDAKELIRTNGQSCPNPDYFLRPLQELDEFEEKIAKAKEAKQ